MLEEAHAITVELRRVLESEVERSRAERQSLKSLDSDQIFAGATAFTVIPRSASSRAIEVVSPIRPALEAA